jgi:hypothetical protein
LQSKFRKRNIRISTCGKRTKRAQQRVATASSQSGAQSSSSQPSEPDTSKATNSKKRKRSNPENDTPAARRIHMKKSLLKEQARGKTFNANKKKGKLGGVIKTAIKKAKESTKKK